MPEVSFVTIRVYDVIGKEVATLVNEEKTAGSYVVEFNRIGLPSGIYFYRIQARGFIKTRKIVLIP
ncbi:MAG: T9SS type A sorting domain-containing protein [Ignavibacteria bacterium]|nr:T9SS type A sorting domain-containing protein [Ignavibacteria bacterium]